MFIVIGNSVTEYDLNGKLLAAFQDCNNINDGVLNIILPTAVREDAVFTFDMHELKNGKSEINAICEHFETIAETNNSAGVTLLFADIMAEEYDQFYYELAKRLDPINMEKFHNMAVKAGFFVTSEQSPRFAGAPYRAMRSLKQRVESFDILFTLSGAATRLLHTKYSAENIKVVEVSPLILSQITDNQEIQLAYLGYGCNGSEIITRTKDNVPVPDTAVVRVGFAGSVAGNEEGFDKFLALIMGLAESTKDPSFKAFNPDILRVQPVVILDQYSAHLFSEDYINSRLLGNNTELKGVLPVEYHVEKQGADVLMLRSLNVLIDSNFDNSPSPLVVQAIAQGVTVLSVVETNAVNNRDPFAFNSVPELLSPVQLIKIDNYLRQRVSTKSSDVDGRVAFAHSFINQLIVTLQESHTATMLHNSTTHQVGRGNPGNDNSAENVVNLFDSARFEQAVTRLKNTWKEGDTAVDFNLTDQSRTVSTGYQPFQDYAVAEIQRLLYVLDTYRSINIL